MKMFQLTEEDLEALERELPEICSSVYPQIDNRLRMKFRRVKEVLSNIRWNYGPPTEVRVIPADGTPPDEQPLG